MKKSVLKNCLLVLVLLVCCYFSCNKVYAEPMQPNTYTVNDTGGSSSNITACNSALGSNVLIDKKIPKATSTIVTVIKIVVPVLLVIFGMIDLLKGLTAQKEDEIKKGQQVLIKRLISGALIFFVFTVVQFLISIVADGEKSGIMDCANCFINYNDCTGASKRASSTPSESSPVPSAGGDKEAETR